ncbi:aspartate/glutamate racemase family protein [Sinorhizobium meliloti]|uniref:hypothetical protein n=1 Tax=Rhizobium meliloti TaxID=382 RepID=UPI00307EF0E0
MMHSNTILGILELDEGFSTDTPSYPPREGSLLNPKTFGTTIITEMVDGALPDLVIQGDPTLENACIRAAKCLVERGANVVAADCGFFIRHQSAISAAVDVPVVTSSLLLIPTLLRQVPAAKKLAIVTADSRHCTEDLLELDNIRDRARVVIGGVEGGEYIRNTLARPFIRTALGQIEYEVGECIARLRADYPEIAIILFECTGFPCVASALRRKTGLPIYDITDLSKIALSARS